MKIRLIPVLLLCLVLWGCGAKQEPETVPPQPETTTEAVPETTVETIPETTVCLKIGGYRLEILQTEENRVSRVLIWHNSVKPAV